MAKKHTVELKANVNSAAFMAEGKLVQLDENTRTLETSDENVARDLVAAHDFLKSSDRKQEG